MKTASAHKQRTRRRLRLAAAGALAALTLAGPALAADTPPPEKAPAPKAPEDLSPAGTISLFDAKAEASIESFFFHSPKAVFPFKVSGGFLQSTAQATSTPRAFGYAGPAPVPLLTSAGIIIPEQIPGTGVAIPEEVRKGFQSIDYTALPNYCQASFPPAKEGGDEAYCGGPAQTQTSLGFNSASVNGHVKTTGNFDQPLTTRTLSESRGEDVFVPALQATYHAAYAKADSGINPQGLPQATGVAEFQRAQFLGNLVTLENVRSQTIVATDGTEDDTATRSTLTVGSAAIFGVPVIITTDGVVASSEAVPGSSPKPLTDQLNKQMATTYGLTVKLIPAPPVQRAGSEVIAESGSIEIAYDSEVPTPVRVVHRVAYSRAAVNALVESGSLDVPLPTSSGSSDSSGGYGGSSSPKSVDTLPVDLASENSAEVPSSDFSASTDAPSSDIAASDYYDPGVAPTSGGGEESGLAAEARITTGDQGLLAAPNLAVPAAVSTLPADELTNVYVGFGILAAAVVFLLPLRRMLMSIGR